MILAMMIIIIFLVAGNGGNYDGNENGDNEGKIMAIGEYNDDGNDGYH